MGDAVYLDASTASESCLSRPECQARMAFFVAYFQFETQGNRLSTGRKVEASWRAMPDRPGTNLVIGNIEAPSMTGWPPVHIIATSAYHPILKGELPTGSVFLPNLIASAVSSPHYTRSLPDFVPVRNSHSA